MSKKLVASEYQGLQFHFTDDAWFNATEAAKHFGKRPNDWLNLKETEQYLEALMEMLGISEKSLLIKTRRGRRNITSQNGNLGTWFHPRLAVGFARWLDKRFAVWCDLQIDTLIRGTHPHYDWKKLRHEATASFKVMTESLRMEREVQGKATANYHYMNEARMVNWAITGEYKKLNRDGLSTDELDLLAKLEVRDAVLLGRGMDYKARKAALELYVSDWKAEQVKGIEYRTGV